MSAARAPYNVRGWPAADDAKLRELWEAGVSMRQIGLAVGRSRSATLCRARRIGLPPRVQPVMYLAGVTRVPCEAPAAVVQPEMLPDPAAPGRPKQPLRLWLVPTAPPRECQWPEGPRRAVRFCGDPAVPDRPYCETHCRVAFVGFGHRTGTSFTFGPTP